MNVDDLQIQQIIAVAGMCLWFLFPFGMFISVIRQDRDIVAPKKFEDYQLHEAAHLDPFTGVKIETEKEFEELKIDDFAHQHISLSPGPDNKHTGV